MRANQGAPGVDGVTQADTLAPRRRGPGGPIGSLSELRRGFEPVAAALAARRADSHQCRIMAAAVSDMVVHGRSGDLESYLLADKIFHRTLLEASGNEMFRALTDVVAEVLSGRTHHGMMPERPNTEAIALHDEVARAIRLRTR